MHSNHPTGPGPLSGPYGNTPMANGQAATLLSTVPTFQLPGPHTCFPSILKSQEPTTTAPPL